MTAQVQGQRKRFTGWRRIVVIIGIILTIIGVVIAILNKIEIIKGGYWYDIVSLVLTAFGLILAFIPFVTPNNTSTTDPTTPTDALPVQTTGATGHNAMAVSGRVVNIVQTISSQQPSPQPTTITEKPQINSSSQHSIQQNPVFRPNTPLNEPKEFYGCTNAYKMLINRINIGGSTAIVGPRCIGKTWLLRYLMLTAANNPMLGSKYRIGYLNAKNPQCHTLTGFVAKALETLKITLPTSHKESINLKTLASQIEQLRSQGIIPILCIDDFEGFKFHSDFELDFLDGLKAMTDEGLVLITVTRTSLIDVVASILGEQSRTSPLHIIMQTVKLEHFNGREAEEFVQAKSTKAGFTEQECHYILDQAAVEGLYSTKQWPSLKLQIVGYNLLDDKRAAKIDQERYRPQDEQYWLEFGQRVKEQYESVVNL